MPDACQQSLQSELKMHEAHVQTQYANCFDCHIEIQHGQIEDALSVNARGLPRLSPGSARNNRGPAERAGGNRSGFAAVLTAF